MVVANVVRRARSEVTASRYCTGAVQNSCDQSTLLQPTSDATTATTTAADIPNRGHSVSSELRLTATSVVDAASEFASSTSTNATAVDGVGIKAACTSASDSSETRATQRLYVLLPNERLYVATGWGLRHATYSNDSHGQLPRESLRDWLAICRSDGPAGVDYGARPAPRC